LLNFKVDISIEHLECVVSDNSSKQEVRGQVISAHQYVPQGLITRERSETSSNTVISCA